MKEQDKKISSSRRTYQKPVVTRIKLDRDISIQMQSPPGDPYGKTSRDSGGFNPIR